MVADVEGRPHPFKKNWSCGNTSKESLCKSMDCIDCESIRTRLRVGLPEVTNYPPMPPCKPPKTSVPGYPMPSKPPCELTDEQERLNRAYEEVRGKLPEPFPEHKNPGKIEDFKIWFEGFYYGIHVDTKADSVRITPNQWECLKLMIKEL